MRYAIAAIVALAAYLLWSRRQPGVAVEVGEPIIGDGTSTVTLEVGEPVIHTETPWPTDTSAAPSSSPTTPPPTAAPPAGAGAGLRLASPLPTGEAASRLFASKVESSRRRTAAAVRF